MSDQSDKVTDILKDVNINLTDIKSIPQLNLEYSGQIEQIFGKVDNLEGFLKDKLSSDFEKIKYVWEDYSAGMIKRRELIGKCIKIIGRKFFGLFIIYISYASSDLTSFRIPDIAIRIIVKDFNFLFSIPMKLLSLLFRTS